VAIFSADDQASAMAKAATASDSGGVDREVFRHHVGVNRVAGVRPELLHRIRHRLGHNGSRLLTLATVGSVVSAVRAGQASWS
jgi:hypothetical protein